MRFFFRFDLLKIVSVDQGWKGKCNFFGHIPIHYSIWSESNIIELLLLYFDHLITRNTVQAMRVLFLSNAKVCGRMPSKMLPQETTKPLA